MRQLKHAKHIVWMTCIIFMIHVLLPFFAVYDIRQALASAPGEKILICTSAGFEWITPEQAERDGKQPHPQFKCPDCYISAHGTKHALPASPPVLIIDGMAFRVIAVPFAPSGLYKRLPPGSRLSRAPPRYRYTSFTV